MDKQDLIFILVSISLQKILRTSYYQPSIFKDSYKYVQSCDEFQRATGRENFSTMPLQRVVPNFPFAKWGLDLAGPINPPSSTSHVFILTIIDYFNNCAETIFLKHAKDEHVISFLESNIFSIFGLLVVLISDNGKTFMSGKLTQLCRKYRVKHFTSLTYYPQGDMMIPLIII
jgi:hypothetical protein